LNAGRSSVKLKWDEYMKILMTGDLYVSDAFRGRTFFEPSVRSLFADADLRIVNLEAPITAGRAADKVLKTGPHLKAAKETVLPVLKDLGVDLATLANNHIRDYGQPGIAETLESLAGAGIRSVGAGRDIAEAAEPFFMEKDGLRLAVLNFGENEWAGADKARGGANPFDVVENLKRIREARRVSDRVMVVIHGGHEDFHYPTPRMVREYRFYAENGASVIVGHHPHCTGGAEVHEGTPIFYSLGNFLFTLPSGFSFWYTGLVLRLEIGRERDIVWELVPVAQAREDFSVRVLEGEAAERVRREVEGFSRTIADSAGLERQWESFLERYSRYYLNVFNPLHVIPDDRVKAGLEKLGLDRLFVTKAQYAHILNIIRCETHAEAAKAVIGRFLKQ